MSVAANLAPEGLTLTITGDLVPPTNFEVLALTVPAAPKLRAVHRSKTAPYLRTLYKSAVMVFWPLHSEQGRFGASERVLLAAAAAFVEHEVAPAAYLQWAFRRAVGTKPARKSPIPPSVVFDPPTLEEVLPTLRTDPAIGLSQVQPNEYLAALAMGTRWVIREAGSLTTYNPSRIQEIVRTVFQDGWQSEYAYAEEYRSERQAQIQKSVKEGQYVWGR